MRIFVAAENNEEGDYCGRKPTDASAVDVVVRKDNSHSVLSPLDSKYRKLSRCVKKNALVVTSIINYWTDHGNLPNARSSKNWIKNRCAPKLSSLGDNFGTEKIRDCLHYDHTCECQTKKSHHEENPTESHTSAMERIYHSESNTFAAMASRTKESLALWLPKTQVNDCTRDGVTPWSNGFSDMIGFVC